jgi:hypothetical protein
MRPSRTMNFKAENKSELLSILRSVDIVGPLGNDYRGRDATEPYAIAHLLSSLAEARDALAFPLELCHRDKPDFLLSMGGKRIGIEHREAKPQREIWMNDIRRREGIGPSVVFEVPVEVDGPLESGQLDRKQIKEEGERLREEIIADDPKGGYGDQAVSDAEWVRVMLRFIAGKEQKLEQYTRYDEDWLLIRDAWPFASVNRLNATNQLCSRLQERKLQFHRVFIVSSENRGPICEVTESAFRLHPRNDLWSKETLGT